MNTWRYLVLMLGVVMLVGCSSKGGEKPSDADAAAHSTPLFDEATSRGGIDGGSGSAGSGFGSGQGTGAAAGGGGIPSERVVYFDFDRSEIRSEAQSVLESHANYLLSNPTAVRLEGHADERGSREYNLALGEGRAESVKRTLAILGVPESLLNTLSYGEEQPINLEHNESAWQLNRRVELIYP